AFWSSRSCFRCWSSSAKPCATPSTPERRFSRSACLHLVRTLVSPCRIIFVADAPLLDVRDLKVLFRQGDTETLAVDGVSFTLQRGRTVGLVGESGSGKSVTALSIVRLLGRAAVVQGQVPFKGEDLLPAREARLRDIRGAHITMVFQEPMTSLNPLHTIERQIGEILELHGAGGAEGIKARTVEVLQEVGIPDPAARLGAFPHQLSGGQRQRVMIAMALANRP